MVSGVPCKRQRGSFLKPQAKELPRPSPHLSTVLRRLKSLHLRSLGISHQRLFAHGFMTSLNSLPTHFTQWGMQLRLSPVTVTATPLSFALTTPQFFPEVLFSIFTLPFNFPYFPSISSINLPLWLLVIDLLSSVWLPRKPRKKQRKWNFGYHVFINLKTFV